MMLPTLLQSAIQRLVSETFSDIPHVNEIINETILSLNEMSKLNCHSEVAHYTCDANLPTETFKEREKLAIDVIKRIQVSNNKLWMHMVENTLLLIFTYFRCVK